jgi:N-acetyl-gamma-glutamyl-phosphate reductase
LSGRLLKKAAAREFPKNRLKNRERSDRQDELVDVIHSIIGCGTTGGIMIRVGVVGATGYAGAELVRILSAHENVELTTLVSRQYAGVDFDSIYPAFKGVVTKSCEALDVDSVCAKSDVVFLALPHKIPMSIVPELLDRGKRVIDLSADFRFRDVETYEAHYQPHTSKELIPRSVYGLSEVFPEDIRNADIIGNPGCYPTSILLPLLPLVKNKMVDTGSIVADAKSGVSGAGRSLSLGTHYCEVTESFKAYKVGEHRHNPEIDEVLSLAAGQSIHITFVPHLVPMSRGMLTTIYAGLSKGVGLPDVLNCLRSCYEDKPFVRILDDSELPETRFVRGTNFCDIGCRIDKGNGRLIIVSAIDNLVKGAAGQAVQNMNIMMGLDETTGLNRMPFPL